MSYSSTTLNPPTIDVQRIIDLCQIPVHRIQSIYLYGSQVYGTNSMSSDLDILVVGSSMHDHKEYHDGTYNVHTKTPDIFQDELWAHKMFALECIYAPDFAKIQEMVQYSNFVYNKVKLQRMSLSESHSSWIRGKRMILHGDIYRGMKSLWHSIRILMFASQILNEGDIYDYSEANGIWETIDESEYVKWNDFKHMLLPIKSDMEDIVKEV